MVSRAPLSIVCWTSGVYPGADVLEEVGRVTIAGSRLDVQMGVLWHHLDRSLDLERCRSAPGAKQCEQVRHLARERLTGDMLTEALATVDAAEVARTRRNEIVHQDWVLRGADAMRPVSELTGIAPEDLATYLERWERESKRPTTGNRCRLAVSTSSPHRLLTSSARSSENSHPQPTSCAS